jgi:DNA repair protein RecO (recombination protein O)
VSEILKDRAVVLRTYDYGETSLVVSFLTRSHGKVRLLAKGAKREKSSFAGALRTGNIGEVVFYFKPDRGLQLLKEIESGSVFENAVEDLERLCIFQAGLEVVDRSVIEREADERVYDLLEGFICAVPGAADPWVALFVLYVRLLILLGVYPRISRCAACGTPLGAGFRAIPRSGEITCDACGRDGALAVSQESAALLELMAGNGFRDFEMERAQRMEIGRFLHNLFIHHVEGYRLPNALNILKEVNGH